MEYARRAIDILKTDEFDRWLNRLRDGQARARILARIARLSFGNPGDVRPVGGGISELRIPYGPGYRLYYTQRGQQVIFLLIGGDKASQSDDVAKAKELAAELGRSD